MTRESAAQCAVLVPIARYAEPECEAGLRELAARGYSVRVQRGETDIDQVRSLMATAALADGFSELLWIDADMGFSPDDVELLRAHERPIVGGLYARRGAGGLACQFPAATREITCGIGGGLVEATFVGAGFLLTRREVYERMQSQMKLPECVDLADRSLVPYFMPSVSPDGRGHWYLSEDFAFCDRARACGFSIWVDTRIRLWHLGVRRQLVGEDLRETPRHDQTEIEWQRLAPQRSDSVNRRS